MTRNTDIPAEVDRRDTRAAWILAPIVVVGLALYFARPFLRAPRVERAGAEAVGAVGIVDSQGVLQNKYAPGGSWQWLKVRLADGRIVDAVAVRPPPLREGDRVTLRHAARGPFQYEAMPAAKDAAR